MQKKRTYLPLLAFCVLGLIWGSNFIYMKLAARLINPMQIAFYRTLCGFIPVLLIFVGVFQLKHR